MRLFGGIAAMLAGGVALIGMTISAPADEKGADALAPRLTGAWLLVSDRDKEVTAGQNPKGSLFFDGTGNFALQMVSGNLPKIAANDRSQGTADENEAVAEQSLAYFGTYDVNEPARALVLHIYYSSFANWRDTDQKWNVTLTSDQLSWSHAAGGPPSLVWQRAPQTGGAVPTTRGGRHY
jgi:hypothetical protein